MKRALVVCIALPLLTVLPVALTGCIVAVAAVGAGIGIGAYSYSEGELTDEVPASPQKVVTAANAAFHDLQMTVISSESSVADGKVVAVTATEKKVKVEIKARSTAISKVSIRVGTWGDEALSVRIMDSIKAHLGITPAPQPVTSAN